jgi:protoporphyrinogen oxidase
MRESVTNSEVIVLGAGLAGLAASLRLLDKGLKPIILEKEDAVGGMCRSLKRDNFVFDLGGHRLLPHNKETADFVHSLFNDRTLSIIERRSQIYLKGKYLFYPPEFSDILKNLGLITCIKCGVDSAYFRIKRKISRKKEVSLKDWLLNRYGPTLYDIYFGPYSFKLWGRTTSHISSDWAPQRIAVQSAGVLLKNLLNPHRHALKSYARQFLYPKGGIGQIAERLADRIRIGGGEVVLNNRVVAVSREADGFVVTTQENSGKKLKFQAKKIISTIPLNEFVQSMRPVPPKEVLHACNGLRFRSVRFLNLMIDDISITPNTWLYVPERKYIFFRIQEFSKWHPDNCPQEKTSLTLEIACDKDGKIWKMKEDELIKACIRDLKKMDIDVEDKILGSFTTFAEHAYPIYSLRYKDHLKTISHYVGGLKDIVLCGRQGLFRYLNMDSVLEDGFHAAESLHEEHLKKSRLKGLHHAGYVEHNIHLRHK